MTMHLNLNTVDFSDEDTCKLIAMLNRQRQSAFLEQDYYESSELDDKAEDMWSVLYDRRKANPEQFERVAMYFELADRGQLSDDDDECLFEGFLP